SSFVARDSRCFRATKLPVSQRNRLSLRTLRDGSLHGRSAGTWWPAAVGRWHNTPFVRQKEGEVGDEGNCKNGTGCGNGRDEAGGAARAPGGGARQPLGRELRRCRCSGSCVGIHLGRAVVALDLDRPPRP